MALARPGTVGGTRCSGVKISSFSCRTYTTIRLSGGGKDFRRLSPRWRTIVYQCYKQCSEDSNFGPDPDPRIHTSD
jgi:hypothetical protein